MINSLNVPLRADGDSEWQDWLVDETDEPGENDPGRLPRSMTLHRDDPCCTVRWMFLNDREKHILTGTSSQGWSPSTLEELSHEYDISAASGSARSRCAPSKSCKKR